MQARFGIAVGLLLALAGPALAAPPVDAFQRRVELRFPASARRIELARRELDRAEAGARAGALRMALIFLNEPGPEAERLVLAALLRPAFPPDRSRRDAISRRYGREVAALLDEAVPFPLEGFAQDRGARDQVFYQRFRTASPAAQRLEQLARLDQIRHLEPLPLLARLAELRTVREHVVPALRVQSPHLAAELETEALLYSARYEEELDVFYQERLAPYRRPDGTLAWRALMDDGALEDDDGQPRLSMGLFLRELALVIQSGERTRMEEFFQGLARTDFFRRYGLFSLGPHTGRMPFARYLEAWVKPRFVTELLRTNAALAAGLALPDVARGDLSGEAVAISLESLGLDTEAFREGLASVRWIKRSASLRSSKLISSLSHLSKFSKLTSFGGWVYTAAELTVILLFSEDVEYWVQSHMDRESARLRVSKAGEDFVAAVGKPGLTASQLELALSRYDEVWRGYRAFLLAPMYAEEQEINGKLADLARRLKELDDASLAARAGVLAQPALRAHAERRTGDPGRYVEELFAPRLFELEAEVDRTLERYLAARARHLDWAYRGERRPGPYLDDTPDLLWNVMGGVDHSPEDPWGVRDDFLARRNRDSARANFHASLRRVSENRLQTYDDERAVLQAVREALRARAGVAVLAPLDEALDALSRTARLDATLAEVAVPERGLVEEINPRERR